MKMYLPPPGERHGRRSFLKKGLFGGLLLAMGGGWLASRPGAVVVVPAGLKVLDARRFAVVRALVERFVPQRDEFPPPLSVGTAEAVDGILAMMDPSARAEVLQLLMLFENALPNFLFGLRTQPFTQLAPDAQAEVLTEWMNSRLALRRTGYLALRVMVMSAYYGNDVTWPAVGYPGPPRGAYDATAPEWRGGGVPRPPGNGVMPPDEAAAPAPAEETTKGEAP